jgi:hypothetical protein
MQQRAEAEDLVFTDDADVRLLLSSLQPAAQAKQLVEVQKAPQQSKPKASEPAGMRRCKNRPLFAGFPENAVSRPPATSEVRI